MTGASSLRIVVLGYIVRGPLGGMAWHHLQYVLGLSRMGHDVWYLEDSDDHPGCYDPDRFVTDVDPTYGLAFASDAFASLGLEDRWAYHDAHADRWRGPAAGHMRETCGSAELLLDLSAVNPVRPWVREIPARALVDTDPGFTQIRHLTDEIARERARAHTRFFTFAGNVDGAATLPDDGLPWQPTRQPVVLDVWPSTPPPSERRYTSVMQWESYPAREHAGVRYGMKADSFEPFADLPARVDVELELALGGADAPREELRRRGWTIVDSLEQTRDPATYQAYIRGSRGEFGIAKHGYVVSRSGWFSERSACYLASGRPVVVQDTGFTDWLETGRGLLSFRSLEEAAAAIEEVESAHDDHARAAREVAEARFSAPMVLGDLVERAMAP